MLLKNAPRVTSSWGKVTRKMIDIMAKFAPIEFFKQVRSEAKKVSWPTRPELVSSTIAVFVMVTIASIFLFVADQALGFLVRVALGLGE